MKNKIIIHESLARTVVGRTAIRFLKVCDDIQRVHYCHGTYVSVKRVISH